MRSIVIALALVAPLTSLSCADTARFTTKEGESYCGTVTAAAFVRAGVEPGTKMRLVLDAEQLQNAPGKLWTDPLPSGEQFKATQLLPIPQLSNDPLSTLNFGEGRVKNALTVAEMTGSEVLVVLSLLQSGDVEVRLLRGTSPGSVPAGTPAGPPQLFGVFRLSKENGDCGLR